MDDLFIKQKGNKSMQLIAKESLKRSVLSYTAYYTLYLRSWISIYSEKGGKNCKINTKSAEKNRLIDNKIGEYIAFTEFPDSRK